MTDEYVSVGATGEEIADWLQPKKMKKGDVVEGIYVDSFSKGEGNKKWTAHKVKKADGKLYALYGTGQLNYKMGLVTKGAKVKITHMGKVKLTEGPGKGNDAFQWDVQTTKPLAATGEEAPF